MMKDNVIFWRDWDEAIRTLPEQEQAEGYRAVLDYAMNETPYTGQSIGIKMLMQFLKPRIDEQTERYNKVCERNRENGQKGGRPRNPEKPNETQENPLGFFGSEIKPNETQENPIKDKRYKDKGKKKKDIIIPIPTIEEVEEYIKTKGYDIDARAFWAYYDAREWMKDGKPIKNWHLQVATWVNNSNRYDKGKHKPVQIISMPRPAEPERDRNVPLLEGNIPGVDYDYIKRLRDEQERKGKLKPQD